MKEHFGQEGVSEIVGVMLLLGLTVIGVALVGIVFLSDSQPDEIPHATIAAGNESGSLALVHEGGDPLREGEYRIYVDIGSGLVDGTDTFSGLKDGAWSVGGSLVYNGPTPERIERVVVTAVSGGSETILAEPEFRGGAERFSPDPVGPEVTQDETPMPGPTLEEIIVSPGIGTSLEIGTHGNDNSFDFAAIIERNDTERVDLIIYKYYDKFNKIYADTMTRDETVAFCYNKTVDINGNIGDIGDRVSITVIAYNTTGVTVSQSVLATIQQK